MRPDRVRFAISWSAVVGGTLAPSVAAPLIFATLLRRIADLPGRGDTSAELRPLVIAYGAILVVSTVIWRIAGWIEWGSTLASFAQAITNGYDHLVGSQPPVAHRPALRRGHLHAWRPSRGPSSSLLDTATWGFLRIARDRPRRRRRPGDRRLAGRPRAGRPRRRSSALVLHRRMRRVIGASKEFSDAHSKATGVVGRHDRQPDDGSQPVGRGPGDGARPPASWTSRSRPTCGRGKVFATTRLQMESSLAGLQLVGGPRGSRARPAPRSPLASST